MNEPKTDILQFQAQLGARLARWSAASITSGAILSLLEDRAWRGFGLQCAAWGLIDLAIASFGLQRARKRAAVDEAHEPEAQVTERASLGRILWINTCLDVGYVSGGLLLANTKGKTDRFLRGAGWGIVIQGAYLFFFDLIHALLLEKDDHND